MPRFSVPSGPARLATAAVAVVALALPTPGSAAASRVPAATAPGSVAAGAVGDTVPAGAPHGTVTLSSGRSGIPPLIRVLGADDRNVLFTVTDSSGDPGGYDFYEDGFFTVPAAGGPTSAEFGIGSPVVRVPPDPQADTQAGPTHVYAEELGLTDWLDIDTHTSGSGLGDGIDPAWQTAVPGGGAWVADVGAGVGLLTTTTADPAATPTELAVLPAAVGGTAVAADTAGILVTRGPNVGYYSFATHRVTVLDTAGVDATGFACTSLTTVAAGCLAEGTAYRIPLDGSAPTSFPAPGVDLVVVTPTATAWTSGPADRLSLAVGGHVSTTGFGVRGIAPLSDDIAYARVDPVHQGIFRTAGSATAARLLTRGPSLPRRTSVIALTPGRVSWIDDSTTGYPVVSRRVLAAAPPRVGPLVTTNPGSAVEPAPLDGVDAMFSPLAVSGRRSLFFARARQRAHRDVGSVLLVGPGGRSVLSTDATGDLAMSGSRALWTTFADHVLMRDLASSVTTDLTRRYGITDVSPPGYAGLGNTAYTGALFGRYLAYAKGGYAWRLDLASGKAQRIGRTSAGDGLGAVQTAGDWVAWPVTIRAGSRDISAVAYRDARIPRHAGRLSSGGGRTLLSVSPAGLVTADAGGVAVFQRWGSTARQVLPAAVGPVRVDAGIMAWIGRDGYPKVAPVPAAQARPQALGTPFAALTVRGGAAWTLDQPFSEALTSCTVVVSAPSGRVVARLRCDAAAAAQGEAVTAWRALVDGHHAPAGKYSWQVTGGDRAGGVLSSTGTPGTPVHGTFRVTG